MNKFTLFIDASNNSETIVSLYVGKRLVKELKEKRGLSSQKVLPLIEKILSECKLTLSDIKDIKVHKGPGSFTGLRVGVSIANTIAWLFGIPINGNKNIIVEPTY